MHTSKSEYLIHNEPLHAVLGGLPWIRINGRCAWTRRRDLMNLLLNCICLLLGMSKTMHLILINSSFPGQTGRHLVDAIFKCIFFNGKFWIVNTHPPKFVLMDPINNNPPLAQIMAWRRPGDKPLSEPVIVNLLTPLCVNELNTKIQWYQGMKTTKLYLTGRIFRDGGRHFCISRDIWLNTILVTRRSRDNHTSHGVGLLI